MSLNDCLLHVNRKIGKERIKIIGEKKEYKNEMQKRKVFTADSSRKKRFLWPTKHIKHYLYEKLNK